MIVNSTSKNFINEGHKKNYLELVKKYPSKDSAGYLTAFSLLAIEDVYNISKDYTTNLTINFTKMFKDKRLSYEQRVICEMAYKAYGISSNIEDAYDYIKDIKSNRFVIDSISNNYEYCL